MNTKSPRRRFRVVRFGIKHALASILLIALLLTLFKEQAYPAYKRRALLMHLKSNGVQLRYGEGLFAMERAADGWVYFNKRPRTFGPAWITNVTGQEWLQESPSSVSFVGARVPPTDEELMALGRFENLEQLDLHCGVGGARAWTPQVSDQGMEYLVELPALRRLNLVTARISDAGIRRLAEMHTLEEINVSQTQMTDEGLASLASMPNLKAISFYKTLVTKEGVLDVMKNRPDIRLETNRRLLPQ